MIICDIFLIFALKHRSWVLSAHDLCFRAKIRKTRIVREFDYSPASALWQKLLKNVVQHSQQSGVLPGVSRMYQ